MNPLEVFREKFSVYRKVTDESGEKKAWDTLFDGYPERQRKNMGKFAPYKQIGMEMEVVDISNNTIDGVLEIQRVCPCLKFGIHAEFKFDKPCHVICEMDVAATQAAFPGMKGTILSRMADGDCVCMFKYERDRK
jgi:hypothetical protein